MNTTILEKITLLLNNFSFLIGGEKYDFELRKKIISQLLSVEKLKGNEKLFLKGEWDKYRTKCIFNLHIINEHFIKQICFNDEGFISSQEQSVPFDIKSTRFSNEKFVGGFEFEIIFHGGVSSMYIHFNNYSEAVELQRFFTECKGERFEKKIQN